MTLLIQHQPDMKLAKRFTKDFFLIISNMYRSFIISWVQVLKFSVYESIYDMINGWIDNLCWLFLVN